MSSTNPIIMKYGICPIYIYYLLRMLIDSLSKCTFLLPIFLLDKLLLKFEGLLNTIEIQIRDNTGSLINIQSGKTVVTLFFRLMKSKYDK